MTTINELLKQKERGSNIWSAKPSNSVYDALEMLSDHDIGALLVLDGENLVGIFSERDYARKLALCGKDPKETQLEEVMTSPVVTISPGQSVEECMEIMTLQHIRHLPVKDGDKLLGMVSIGDVVKGIISHQGFLIDQLEKYITGGR